MCRALILAPGCHRGASVRTRRRNAGNCQVLPILQTELHCVCSRNRPNRRSDGSCQPSFMLMIGSSEFLWYNLKVHNWERKRERLHKRFFGIHPYTLLLELCWSQLIECCRFPDDGHASLNAVTPWLDDDNERPTWMNVTVKIGGDIALALAHWCCIDYNPVDTTIHALTVTTLEQPESLGARWWHFALMVNIQLEGQHSDSEGTQRITMSRYRDDNKWCASHQMNDVNNVIRYNDWMIWPIHYTTNMMWIQVCKLKSFSHMRLISSWNTDT